MGFIRVVFLFFIMLTSASVTYAEEVIANSSVNQKVVDRSFLLSTFSMRLNRWPDGTPMRVFVLPDDHELHGTFVKNSLEVFPYQLRSIWDRAVFSGAGRAPTQVEDISEMLEKVSTTRGAIGYITQDVELVKGVHKLEVK